MTTPLFTSDLSSSPRSKLEQMLIQISGDDKGVVRCILSATVDDAVAATSPGKLEPANNDAVTENAKYHPLIVWESSKFSIIPGPGSFGRVVTLFYGWRTPGQPAPAKKEDFQKLAGYTYLVLGGAANPVFSGEWMEPPFNGVRHKVIKSSFLSLTNPLELYWYAEETDVAEKKGSGARAFIRWEGEVRRYGDFY